MKHPAVTSPAPEARTMAVGVFDGVHLGHQHMIKKVVERAKQTSTIPCVMTFDPHPLQIINPDRAPRLLSPVEERSRLLRREGIQEVIVKKFDEATRNLSAEEFLSLLSREYNVTQLIVGFNHRFGCDGKACTLEDYRTMAEKWGITLTPAGEVKIGDREGGVSSSAIRRLIENGEMERAGEMLSRPYSVGGTVVRGRGMGRTIGFPTANLQPLCERQLLPPDGVYAAVAEISGEKWPAVVNVGKCPSVVKDAPKSTIEAHLMGCQEDLYGKNLTLLFHKKLRDEQKFPSVDALREQIKQDTTQTENYFKHKNL